MGTLERMAMKVLAISAATLLVCAIVAVAMLNTTADFQDLAGKAAKAKATSKALSYGSTVTLMNPYNLYMLVQKNGEINMGGFLHGNNNIKIVSPGGKKGAVKYGDEVSLMGENGKYFLVRYSGKITSRASVIACDTKWKILGGSGGVHIADRVNFKSEFGYLHVSDDGCRSVDALTAAEKFLIGLPGQETGLKSHNGMLSIKSKPAGNWDHFTILSAIHTEGIISYGNKIVLRAHNGRMVSVRLDTSALEAVSLSITDRSEFTIVGSAGFSTGVVHTRDKIALRTFQGYVEAEVDAAIRVTMGQSGHYGPSSQFLINKVWDSSL